MYQYNDSTWGDLLTSYKGHTITYDEIGNPLSYYGRTSYTFTWEKGRQLVTAKTGGYTLSFEYNDQGIRTSKTVNGVKHTYSLEGSLIVSEEYGDYLLIYLYDETNSPYGIIRHNKADGTTSQYYLERDVFGNIIAIYNRSGTKVVSYCYDAWGNCTVVTNTDSIATMNPFRYRGYYLDVETNLYYLQTRYYDSYVGRFINADRTINGNGDIVGFNMFTYCSNNPVMFTDPVGQWTISFGLSLNLSFWGIGTIGSIGLSFDSEEMWALQYSYAVPKDDQTFYMPLGQTASGGLYFQSTNHDSVVQLEDDLLAIGANLPIVGADVILDDGMSPCGASVSLGASVGADVHMYHAQTYTVGGPHRSLIKFLRDEWGWFK